MEAKQKRTKRNEYAKAQRKRRLWPQCWRCQHEVHVHPLGDECEPVLIDVVLHFICDPVTMSVAKGVGWVVCRLGSMAACCARDAMGPNSCDVGIK